MTTLLINMKLQCKILVEQQELVKYIASCNMNVANFATCLFHKQISSKRSEQTVSELQIIALCS